MPAQKKKERKRKKKEKFEASKVFVASQDEETELDMEAAQYEARKGQAGSRST